MARYAVDGQSEDPIRCDEPWPLHEQDIALAGPDDHRLVEKRAAEVVGSERPCPSASWFEIVRLDPSIS